MTAKRNWNITGSWENPIGVPSPNEVVSDEVIANLVREHHLKSHAEAFRNCIHNCVINYLTLAEFINTEPPVVATKVQARALTKVIAEVVELLGSAGMRPRLEYGFGRTYPRYEGAHGPFNKCLDRNIRMLQELKLFATEAVDFNAVAYSKQSEMKMSVRVPAFILINFWKGTGGNPSLNNNATKAFVLECLYYITGTEVSEHAIRHIDKPDPNKLPPKPKRKRVESDGRRKKNLNSRS